MCPPSTVSTTASYINHQPPHFLPLHHHHQCLTSFCLHKFSDLLIVYFVGKVFIFSFTKQEKKTTILQWRHWRWEYFWLLWLFSWPFLLFRMWVLRKAQLQALPLMPPFLYLLFSHLLQLLLLGFSSKWVFYFIFSLNLCCLGSWKWVHSEFFCLLSSSFSPVDRANLVL